MEMKKIMRCFSMALNLLIGGDNLRYYREIYADELDQFRAAFAKYGHSEASIKKALFEKSGDEKSFLEMFMKDEKYNKQCLIGLLADKVVSHAFCAAQPFMTAYLLHGVYRWET